MVSILLISFMIVMISVYFLHETVKSEINQINYHAIEVITTNGILTQSLYEGLLERGGRFGSISIQLKLEKQIKPGVYDTFFDKEEIVDKRLEIGDRITIYIEDEDLSLFGRMINGSFLGYQITNRLDYRVHSVKTGIIAKNAKDLVKGYDIIAEIDLRANEDEIAILVVTKRAGSGKYYGWSGHPDVLQTNRIYGDQEDERASTGINYIYDHGDFVRTKEYYSTGELRLIKYVQQ